MDNLLKLAKQISSCRRCHLYQSATQAVPGEGSPEAKLMFIGEGPGFWEDKIGRPFVGPAGKLLDRLLQSIKLAREDIFIGNIIKHRPPQNRDPLPDEIEACSIWLDQQLGVIQPEIIVTLGRFSMAKFIPEGKISKIHGILLEKEYQGRKFKIIPMYHPAAALRNTKILHELETDFQKLRLIFKQHDNS